MTHIFGRRGHSRSPSLTPLALIAATSEPSSGSLMLNAARISPVAIRGNNRSRCASVPNFINK